MMKKWISALLDTFFPNLCASCHGRLLQGEKLVCTNCLQDFPKTGFGAKPNDNEVAYALAGWVNVNKAASLYYYIPDSKLSNVVKKMKYAGRDDICRYMGEILANEMIKDDFFFGIDAIIPVPLHKKRLKKRGYNQSEQMAIGINKLTGILIITDAVQRTVYQENQARKRHDQRERNIAGAFSLVNPSRIAGKHILVLDDVITTGSTIGTCCRELSKAPNVTISVLSLCKTH